MKIIGAELETVYSPLSSVDMNNARDLMRRSPWPRRLRHEMSSPAQTLGSLSRIPLKA
jgi:hypothetical protein